LTTERNGPAGQDVAQNDTGLDLTIALPVYNEVEAVRTTILAVKDVADGMGVSYEIVAVNDGSSDGTTEILDNLASELDGVLRVIKHPYNLGNGASVKTAIRAALGEVLVLMDADGQHNPADIPRLYERVGPYDLVVAARTRQTKGDWPRRFANLAFEALASYLTDFKIKDLTSGFRAFKTELVLGFVHLLPNKFSYPTTTTMAFIKAGHTVDFVTVEAAKREGKSKVRPARDGVRFLIIIGKMVVLFEPLRVFLPAAIMLFLMAVASFVFTLVDESRLHIPNSAVFLAVSAVIVFLIGMVAEQVAELRISLGSRRR
jgi:glycosyltransferase involved in cell wall biosynthesis